MGKGANALDQVALKRPRLTNGLGGVAAQRRPRPAGTQHVFQAAARRIEIGGKVVIGMVSNLGYQRRQARPELLADVLQHELL